MRSSPTTCTSVRELDVTPLAHRARARARSARARPRRARRRVFTMKFACSARDHRAADPRALQARGLDQPAGEVTRRVHEHRAARGLVDRLRRAPLREQALAAARARPRARPPGSRSAAASTIAARRQLACGGSGSAARRARESPRAGRRGIDRARPRSPRPSSRARAFRRSWRSNPPPCRECPTANSRPRAAAVGREARDRGVTRTRLGAHPTVGIEATCAQPGEPHDHAAHAAVAHQQVEAAAEQRAAAAPCCRHQSETRSSSARALDAHECVRGPARRAATSSRRVTRRGRRAPEACARSSAASCASSPRAPSVAGQEVVRRAGRCRLRP